MTARIAIKSIQITDDTLKQDQDQRRLSGTVLVRAETSYGAFELEMPFSNVQLLDRAATQALSHFQKLLGELDQALRFAQAEYVFSAHR